MLQKNAGLTFYGVHGKKFLLLQSFCVILIMFLFFRSKNYEGTSGSSRIFLQDTSQKKQEQFEQAFFHRNHGKQV